jgi:hypothetical protein
MAFTITGAIQSDVWLEYSTDGGSTWTRLTTLFPAGSSIVTNDLPTNIDLKVRLVAFCDETLVSNVLDYDYVAPPPICTQYRLSNGAQTDANYSYTDCTTDQPINTFLGGFETVTICAKTNTVNGDAAILIETLGSC